MNREINLLQIKQFKKRAKIFWPNFLDKSSSRSIRSSNFIHLNLKYKYFYVIAVLLVMCLIYIEFG